MRELNQNQLDKIELGKFIYDNPELERLEAIIDQFNIFSSLGIINQEIRHSNFLAWLLDPSETHGLSDYFTNLFLKLALKNSTGSNSKLSIFDIETFDLTDVKVYREWHNIDVLLVDEANQFVCVIENKIDSSEHSGQLAKYRKEVESHFHDYKNIFIYLTVQGESPESNPEYISVRHKEIVSLIDTLLQRRKSQMNDDVVLFIQHYTEMLKRYIMEESEVQVLCEMLYKKHQKALELIYKYRPDIYSDVQVILEEIIDENPSLIRDHCSRTAIRFIPKSLDFFPKVGKEWTKTRRVLLFEIQNYNERINMNLIIGPTETHGHVREMIFNLAKENAMFKNAFTQLSAKWSTIHRYPLPKIQEVQKQVNREKQKELLSKEFNKFIESVLPSLESVIMSLKDQVDIEE
jgi:hypothetical protein